MMCPREYQQAANRIAVRTQETKMAIFIALDGEFHEHATVWAAAFDPVDMS